MGAETLASRILVSGRGEEPADFEEALSREDDSYLAWLAVRAAGFFDEKLLGRTSDSSPVEKLASLLNTEVKKCEGGEINCNARSFLIFWETLKKFPGNERISVVGEVALKITDVARQLRDYERLSEKQSKYLRDFCCRLSEQVLANYGDY